MFNKLRGLFSSRHAAITELNINEISEFISNEFASELSATNEKISLVIKEIFKEFSLLKALINELKEKQEG